VALQDVAKPPATPFVRREAPRSPPLGLVRAGFCNILLDSEHGGACLRTGRPERQSDEGMYIQRLYHEVDVHYAPRLIEDLDSLTCDAR
jgi:hypothetical protein